MSSSEAADSSSPVPITLGHSLPNYVELAALVIPQRKLGVRDRLRRACEFLPMPLILGWDADTGDEEAPPDSTVPGLMLSDIGSGAARSVTAKWMHALYKQTTEKHPPGTMVMHLAEADYTAHFGWPHALILAAFLIQLLFVIVAMVQGHRRTGWFILTGSLIRVFEATVAFAYPRDQAPRTRDTPRSCVLHTGMTTTHILVITHQFGLNGKCVNLEDAAKPLPRKAHGWKGRLEESLKAAVKLAILLHKSASLVTPANGYSIPLVLLFGTLAFESVAAFADGLPAMAPAPYGFNILETGNSVLDRVTAACQATRRISVGFVESLLPDPQGHHEDYNWILKVMQHDLANAELDPHKTHPDREKVLESTLRRRTPLTPPVQRPGPAAVAEA